MITKLLTFLAQLVIACISALGYGGIFGLMFLESCGVPAPSEVIMPFAGYLAFQGKFSFWFVVFLGTLGNILGSALAYGIGRRGGRPLLERYGRYLGISARHLTQADGWFARYGELTVFVGRLLPIVRTYISFPAGAARMPFKKFLLYTTFGVIPWSILFAWLGVVFADHWEQIHTQLRFLDIFALGVVGGIIGWLWYKKRKISQQTLENGV